MAKIATTTADRTIDNMKDVAAGGIQVLEAVGKQLNEFKPIEQLWFAVTGLLAVLWAFTIEVGDSDVAVHQGENYFPFKVTLLQSFMGILGIMLLVLVFAGMIVKCFSKDTNTFDFQDSNFDKVFNSFVIMFEKHVSTLLFVGALFPSRDSVGSP